jgi:hypothetical protein
MKLTDDELALCSEALRIASAYLLEQAEWFERTLPRANAPEVFRKYAEQMRDVQKRIEAR